MAASNRFEQVGKRERLAYAGIEETATRGTADLLNRVGVGGQHDHRGGGKRLAQHVRHLPPRLEVAATIASNHNNVRRAMLDARYTVDGHSCEDLILCVLKHLHEKSSEYLIVFEQQQGGHGAHIGHECRVVLLNDEQTPAEQG